MMTTLTKKSKSVQKRESSNRTTPGRSRHRQSQEMNALLQLQRTVGNQAVGQLLEQDTILPRVPAVQRKKVTNPRQDKVWQNLQPEQRKVLARVAQGQNFAEVAVQLKLDAQTVKSHWETIVAAYRAAWEVKPEETVDESWLRQHFAGYKQLTTIELRDLQPGAGANNHKPQSQDETVKTADGHTMTWDSFDYTLVIEPHLPHRNPDLHDKCSRWWAKGWGALDNRLARSGCLLHQS